MRFRLSWFFLLIGLGLGAQQSKEINLKRYQVAVVSDTLQEISGLTFWDHRLFAVNDSGNKPDIYELNAGNGKIMKTYQTNAQNVDWESITHDGNDFYIGDFGNNLGNRQDLTIYKIPFNPLETALKVQTTIPFYYPEQKDFSPRNLNTDFDGEAMIFHRGKIHVFTKEWRSMKVSHYVVDPGISARQPAKLMEEYATGFAVTDASYHEGKLYLVGYTKLAEVYLMVFKESDDGLFFKGKPQKYYLGMATGLSQIEGVAATDKGIYISGERFKVAIFDVKPRLYFIPYSGLD